MAERSGAGGGRFGRNFNYQEWATGGFRFAEPDAHPAQDEEAEDAPTSWPDRGERAAGPRVEGTEQGLGDMSQREVDDSSYDYDDVPNRFDIDGYGSGLFGGPGADLFGAHGLPDSVPEQLPYHTGPQPVVRREENPAADSGSLVRPYTRTGGRTRPDYDLAIEALVSTSERGLERDAAVLPEHRSICGLCTDTRSVAEVAAHLRLPLGVVRVLIGDMASMGLVLIHQGGLVVGDRPSIEFLERVLSGLRRL
ncbi:DUF742 domain-containing protein [Saccharothrix coeruleofusca]|uniref:DUF742 domain-containing protein n=1 Tax=Saccharothrix coeruleofusca TaxID=33919 RepID=A0A918AIW8_9PSEU|nr:DUF742 domain-containing protein [Saccharothrix coeruleofusca]MBP2340506.1 hypothetical protein [Saccharothrix coeruleofusca]GGP34970.1 hypothetical protein GCM10010185_02140 [Saccharothrix coeruleofusca]